MGAGRTVLVEMLVGRVPERRRLDALLADAYGGRGGALLLRGEPGVGKTALLEYAVERAPEATVVRATGVESEAELPFGALTEILRPLLPGIDALPSRHAEALDSALGISIVPPADRFTVGAATLGLLAAAADDAPLLVVVDDAHWIDAASAPALLFAIRRIDRDPIVVLLAMRDEEDARLAASGVEELQLGGLDAEAAAALLEEASPVRPEPSVARRDRGDQRQPARAAGASADAWPRAVARACVDRGASVGASLERAFAARALRLGERVRRALLLAAAIDSGRLESIVRAVDAAGLGLRALEQAEDGGLIELEAGKVRFRHPLVRSAIYHGAAPSERRAAHRILAASADPGDPERAWHLAAAAVATDPEAAAALDESAALSRRRGAYAAAAAAYARAARLTDDSASVTPRLAAAADCAWLAGDRDGALGLIHEGLELDADPPLRADLLYQRALIQAQTGEPALAYHAFLEAAEIVAHADPDRAVVMLVEAVTAGIQSGGAAASEAAGRLRGLPRDSSPFLSFVAEQALGLAASVEGRSESVDMLRNAVEQLDGALDLASPLHLFWAGRAHFALGQNEEAAGLAGRALARAREIGAVGLLPQVLRLDSAAAYDLGDWRRAYALAGEAVELGGDLGQHPTVCACLGLLADIDAGSGNREACEVHARDAIALARELGLGFYRERGELALGRLRLVLGELDLAVRQFEAVAERLERAGNNEINVSPAWDLIETYARAGDVAAADSILSRYQHLPAESAPGELAVLERCRGIVAAGGSYERHFEEAIGLHHRRSFPFEQARTELCYGERLRRAGKRERAREWLRLALGRFEEIGADAWARRARDELRASGEHLRPGSDARDFLTPRETQIALHVAEGLSNRDVAGALYLTPKTVEHHLTRIYRKLGVRSRTELAARLAKAAPTDVGPARP